MFRMSNTESLAVLGEGFFGVRPPFSFLGGISAIGVSLEGEERMCLGEDMGIEDQRGWSNIV